MSTISFHSIAAKNMFRKLAFSYGWLNESFGGESQTAIVSGHPALLEQARNSAQVYQITGA